MPVSGKLPASVFEMLRDGHWCVLNCAMNNENQSD